MSCNKLTYKAKNLETQNKNSLDRELQTIGNLDTGASIHQRSPDHTTSHPIKMNCSAKSSKTPGQRYKKSRLTKLKKRKWDPQYLFKLTEQAQYLIPRSSNYTSDDKDQIKDHTPCSDVHSCDEEFANEDLLDIINDSDSG